MKVWIARVFEAPGTDEVLECCVERAIGPLCLASPMGAQRVSKVGAIFCAAQRGEGP
jgi:hypothetical protein